jgi:hypothetical protein
MGSDVPRLVPDNAVYRWRQAMPDAIGFDEV